MRRHTGGSPGRLIDVVEAFDALQLCAKTFASTGPAGAGLAGDCTPLVGSALARIGLTADTMRTAPLFPEPGHPRCPLAAGEASGLTLGALLLLRAAERAERRGADPLTSVRHARAVLLKYVSVLPGSLFQPARARPDPEIAPMRPTDISPHLLALGEDGDRSPDDVYPATG